jgi:hypothetical protein
MKLEWGIKLATLALAIGSCGVVQGREGVAEMTIYYVPFAVETLTPITSANIQERGKRCDVHSAEDIDKIKKVLRGATKPPVQKFSDGRVRLQLLEPSVAGDHVLAVVEKEGEVRFSDGTEGSISPKGLKTFKKIVEAQCRP